MSQHGLRVVCPNGFQHLVLDNQGLLTGRKLPALRALANGCTVIEPEIVAMVRRGQVAGIVECAAGYRVECTGRTGTAVEVRCAMPAFVHPEHGGVLGKMFARQQGTHGVQFVFHLDTISAAIFLKLLSLVRFPKTEHLVGSDVSTQGIDAVFVSDARPVSSF